MWFVYALVFALASTFTVLIAKKIMQGLDEYTFLATQGVFNLLFLFLIVVVFFQIPETDSTFLYSLLISTIIGVIGAVMAYRAIKISEISLVNPISSFNPVFTAIISFVTLRERIDNKGVLGILLIVCGAYLLQVSKSKEGLFAPIRALLKHKGVQMSFVAYFLWAITPTFEKTAILHTDPQTPAFASLIATLFSVMIYGLLSFKLVKSKKRLETIKKNLKLFILGGILGGVGGVSAYTAFSLGQLGLVTAVFKLSMIFTVILGAIFFKEKNIRDRLLGSLVMLLGVVLIVT